MINSELSNCKRFVIKCLHKLLKKTKFAEQSMHSHSVMPHYSKDTIDKIGNAIIYISLKTPSLNKTKLLKLLYLLEENSARMFQTPFFGIEFQAWQHGPVAGEIFIDLSDDSRKPKMLKDYVELHATDTETMIKAKKDFDDSEFSDNDIEVMDYVIAEYGKKNASTLVRELHKKGSAWHRVVMQNNLWDSFEKNLATSSQIPVDVTVFLTEDSKEKYMDTFQMWEEMAKFKS